MSAKNLARSRPKYRAHQNSWPGSDKHWPGSAKLGPTSAEHGPTSDQSYLTRSRPTNMLGRHHRNTLAPLVDLESCRVARSRAAPLEADLTFFLSEDCRMLRTASAVHDGVFGLSAENLRFESLLPPAQRFRFAEVLGDVEASGAARCLEARVGGRNALMRAVCAILGCPVASFAQAAIYPRANRHPTWRSRREPHPPPFCWCPARLCMAGVAWKAGARHSVGTQQAQWARGGPCWARRWRKRSWCGSSASSVSSRLGAKTGGAPLAGSPP